MIMVSGDLHKSQGFWSPEDVYGASPRITSQVGQRLSTIVVTDKFVTHAEDYSYNDIRYGGSNQLGSGWTIDLHFVQIGDHVVDTEVDVVSTTDVHGVTTETGRRHTFRDNLIDHSSYALEVRGNFGGGSGLSGNFTISADGGSTSKSTEDITMIDGTITDRAITELLTTGNGYHFQMSAGGNGFEFVTSAGGGNSLEQNKRGNLDYEVIDGTRMNDSGYYSRIQIDGFGDTTSSGGSGDKTIYRMTRYFGQNGGTSDFLINQHTTTRESNKDRYDGQTNTGYHEEQNSTTRVVNANDQAGPGKATITSGDFYSHDIDSNGNPTGIIDLVDEVDPPQNWSVNDADLFAEFQATLPFFDPLAVVSTMMNYVGGGYWDFSGLGFLDNGASQTAPNPTGSPVATGTEPDGTYWERYDNGVVWIYREYASQGGELVKEEWGYHTQSFYDLLQGFNQLIEEASENVVIEKIDEFFADLTEVGASLSETDNTPKAARELDDSTEKLLDFLELSNEPPYEYATVVNDNLSEDELNLTKEIIEKFNKDLKSGKSKLSDKLDKYLEGLKDQNLFELKMALAQILQIIEKNGDEILNNPGDFVSGFGSGIVEGITNNIDEIWELIKSGLNIGALIGKTVFYKSNLVGDLVEWALGIENPGKAANRRELEKLAKDIKDKTLTFVNIGISIGNLLDSLGDKLGDKAQRVLEAILSGDEEALKGLGDEDAQIALLLLSLSLDVLDQYKDLSAEDQGKIFGQLTAELGILVAGAAASGGTSVALKSGKLAAIANKLKALEKAGDLSDTLKKFIGKDSRFGRKLDEFVRDQNGTIVNPLNFRDGREALRQEALRNRTSNFPFEKAKHSNRTHPSGTRGGKPEGNPKPVNEGANADGKRSLRRENEIGEILANEGYFVEYLPEVKFEGVKNPDFRIEGKIFDGYSPSTSSVREILDTVNKKVADRQAARVVVNLADSNVSYSDLKREFKVQPGGLRPDVLEVIVIDKHGNLRKLYP